MLDKKDIENLIDAFKDIFTTKDDLKLLATKEDLEIFPTAKMMKDSFESVATREQIQEVHDRLEVIEEKIERLEGIPARVKTLEESLEI